MLNYRWINNRKTFGRKRSQTYLCRPEKWMPKGLFRGNGSVVQLVRMPPCHGGGRGFESRPVRKSLTSLVRLFLFIPFFVYMIISKQNDNLIKTSFLNHWLIAKSLCL